MKRPTELRRRPEPHHPAPFLKRLSDLAGPRWLPLLIIFFALYVPFLLKYGWGYRHTPNADLPTFHAASVTVFEQGKSPYDHENLRRLRGDRVPPFLYPPPSLLFFFPLSGLTYPTARQLILFLNHLLFLILVWAIPLYLLRAEPGQGFAVFAVCFVYSLTSDPVAVTLNYGQVNILFLAFLVIFWLLARRRNAILAALFLALAILLKTYPLILIPLLLLIGRWRESVYTVACLGLALIASLMILPNVVWHDWLTNILPTGGYTRIFAGLIPPAATWNQSLNGFFARAFTESKWSNPLLANPDLARFLTYTFAGLALVATGLAAWRSFRIHADSLDRTILAALPLMYLLAPLSWVHHIVYLLPSMLMLLNSRSSFGAVPKFMFYTLCVGSAVLLGIPYMPQFKFYGVAVLWGLALFTACSRAIELPNKSLGRNEDYPLARQG